MITPLVYEVHDDNDPRHFYTNDAVRPSIDSFIYQNKVDGFKKFIVSILPIYFINKLGYNIPLKQSVDLKLNREIHSRITNMYIIDEEISNRVNDRIKTQLGKFIYTTRRMTK